MGIISAAGVVGGARAETAAPVAAAVVARAARAARSSLSGRRWPRPMFGLTPLEALAVEALAGVTRRTVETAGSSSGATPT